MATAYKVLGQTQPSAGVLTDHYSVPTATRATVSSIVICNLSSVAALVRVRVAGAPDEDKQAVVHDLRVRGNDVQPLTIGMTLGALDVIRVWSDSGWVAFSTFGAEVT